MSGVIITDQVRSLDLRAWRAECLCNLDSASVAQVLDLIGVLVSPD